jgi:hypothetical protein
MNIHYGQIFYCEGMLQYNNFTVFSEKTEVFPAKGLAGICFLNSTMLVFHVNNICGYLIIKI